MLLTLANILMCISSTVEELYVYVYIFLRFYTKFVGSIFFCKVLKYFERNKVKRSVKNLNKNNYTINRQFY